MEPEKYDLLEDKLQRLEDLLYAWREDNSKREMRLEQRLMRNLVKYFCIIVAALGAIWSVVELTDWYWQKYELNQLAKAYSESADSGYKQTRNPKAALEIINKALTIAPGDPDLHYKQLYYQCNVVLKQLPAQRYLYSAADLKNLDMLHAGVTLQKKLTPGNGELYLLEAQLLQKSGKHKLVPDIIQKAVDNGADPAYAEYLRIKSFLEEKRYEDAMNNAQKIVKICPESKYSHCSYAEVLARKKLYAEAQKYFLAALEYDPEDYEALLGVITCAARDIPRDYQTERKYCKTALRYYPQDVDVHVHLIRSYIAEERYDLAEIYLKKTERLQLKDAEIYAAKAELYLKKRDFTQAEQAVLLAFEAAPENTNIQRQIVSLYIAGGKFGKAIEYNRSISIMAQEMNRAPALNNAAWRFYLLGTEYKFAEKLSRRAVELDKNSYYFGTLADILFQMGEHEQALKVIDEAIAFADSVRKAVHLIDKALMLIRLKQSQKALALIAQAEKYAPDYYRLHLAKGEYFLSVNDMEKAALAAASGEKCSSNEFEKTELLMLEAKIKAAGADWKNAQQLQKKALLKIDNSFSEIRIAYQNYAIYALRAGDRSEAEKAIAVLNEISPNHPEVLKLTAALKNNTAI